MPPLSSILQNTAPPAVNNSPVQRDNMASAPFQNAEVTPVSAVSLPAVSLPVATRVASNVVLSNSRASVFGTTSGLNVALVQDSVASAKLAATGTSLPPSQVRKRLSSFGSNESSIDGIDNSPSESLNAELGIHDVLTVPIDILDSLDASVETVTEPLTDSQDQNPAVRKEIVRETSQKPARGTLRATNIDQFMADFASDSFRE